ncbi:MAG: hypothetical protein QXH80_01370 [Candidatus Nanoarchaeia archaeon]
MKSLHFDIQVNLPLAILLICIAIAIVIMQYFRQKKLVAKKYLIVLLSVKLLAIALLALLIFKPYLEKIEPDPSMFKVCFLADASGSMLDKDCNGKKRIDVLKEILSSNLAKNFKAANTKIENSEIYLFAEEKVKYFGGEFDIMPGGTAIGTILKETIQGSIDNLPAAIILLSDGNSNKGEPLTDTAKFCAAKGIPINTIGIGGETEAKDFSLSVPKRDIEGKKGQEVKIPFKIKHNFSIENAVTAELLQNGKVLAFQNIALKPNTEFNGFFATTPIKSGKNVYMIRIQAGKNIEDSKSENNSDFAVVHAREPDIFKILYLGAFLDWNFTFLKRNCLNNKQFQFDAIIQQGKNNFFRTNNIAEKIPKEQKDFPENPEIFYDYDAIIIDIRNWDAFPQNYAPFLAKFAGDKGGGLLIFAFEEKIPEALSQVFPMKKITVTEQQRKGHITFDTSFIFDKSSSELLFAEPGLFLPERMPYFVADELKPGAKSIASDRNPRSILCFQNFGAGKIISCGLPSNWRWHLFTDLDMRKYGLFWDGILLWLASGGKERISAQFDGKRLLFNEEAELSVKVLDNEYISATDAAVTLLISQPESNTVEVPLNPSAENPGTYSANFVPLQTGEYDVEISAKFANGETLRSKANFIAIHGGTEFISSEYSEKNLMDIARISGGNFYHYTDILKGAKNIELSKNIPKRKQKFELCNFVIFPIVIFSLLAIEWFLRRRIGLK